MHVLRLTTDDDLSDAKFVNGTVYEVFAAALTLGSFYDETMST